MESQIYMKKMKQKKREKCKKKEKKVTENRVTVAIFVSP